MCSATFIFRTAFCGVPAFTQQQAPGRTHAEHASCQTDFIRAPEARAPR